MTAAILHFPTLPSARARFHVVTLTNLDGSFLAARAFPRGQVGAVWRWIEDTIRSETEGPGLLISVTDDDVITVDGMPVARVAF